MKKLVNPTHYFHQQAEHINVDHETEIQLLVNRLLDSEKCKLCRNNYDLMGRIPRILVHCGHTFCTPCIEEFHTNKRVRCPMCLKLIKNIDSVHRLPINHTIFEKIFNQSKAKGQQIGAKMFVSNAGHFLRGQYQRAHKKAERLKNVQKIDKISKLPYCILHSDRVQHFFCETHMVHGCRACITQTHKRDQCRVVDLYNIENPQRYQFQVSQNIGIFEPKETRDQDVQEKIYTSNLRKMPTSVENFFLDDQDNEYSRQSP